MTPAQVRGIVCGLVAVGEGFIFGRLEPGHAPARLIVFDRDFIANYG